MRGYSECFSSSSITNQSWPVQYNSTYNSWCLLSEYLIRWSGHICHLHREWEYCRQFLIFMIIISLLFVRNIFINQLLRQSECIISRNCYWSYKKILCSVKRLLFVFTFFFTLFFFILTPCSPNHIEICVPSPFEISSVHPHRLLYCIALQCKLHKIYLIFLLKKYFTDRYFSVFFLKKEVHFSIAFDLIIYKNTDMTQII